MDVFFLYYDDYYDDDNASYVCVQTASIYGKSMCGIHLH